MYLFSCKFSYCNYFFQQEKVQKEALTRKQKNRSKHQEYEEDQKKIELLTKPKEYIVKFTFPGPPPLAPPVLGLHGMLSPSSTHNNKSFAYVF